MLAISLAKGSLDQPIFLKSLSYYLLKGRMKSSEGYNKKTAAAVFYLEKSLSSLWQFSLNQTQIPRLVVLSGTHPLRQRRRPLSRGDYYKRFQKEKVRLTNQLL